MKDHTRTIIKAALDADATLGDAARRAILTICDDPDAFTRNSPAPFLSEKPLTVPEVAEFLHVSERTIWRRINEGTIPSIRMGASRRVRPTDLHAWIESIDTDNGHECTLAVTHLQATG